MLSASSNGSENVDLSLIVVDEDDKNITTATASNPSLSLQQSDLTTTIIEQQELLNTDEESPRHKMSTSISIIQNYNREIICLLALILTTYAAIQNRYSKTSYNIYQSTNPIPIFGNYYKSTEDSTIINQINTVSYVQEWPQGFLTTVQTRVTLSDMSVILFYAPWCANSHFIKQSYEQLAKLFYKKIYFAAVNCWQPGGDCRLQHNTVKIWPIIVVYLPKNLAIQYNGPLFFKPLYKFFNNLLNPIKRLHNINELNHLKLYNNIIVVGFFKNINNWYQKYYRVSLKWLEHDPFQDLVKFAGITGESISEFDISIKNSSCIRIYYGYSNDMIDECRNKWKVDDILYWIKNHIDNIPKLWFNFNQYERNNTLKWSLNNGPTLLYFVKRDYINNDNNNYEKDILRNLINTNLLENSVDNLTVNHELKYWNYEKKNQKLSYIMLDIYIFYKFAIKSGITNLLNNTKYSINKNTKSISDSIDGAVVIIDNDHESIYHLKKSLNYDNIKQFIDDFQKNKNLTRTLRSSNNKKMSIITTNKMYDTKKVYIPEIDQYKFHQIINHFNINNNKTITHIILITTKSCSLCNLLMLNLLKLSRILQDIKNIEFYQIDGNLNDLIWQYTMGNYPSLLIFHKNNINSNIRKFPNNLIPNDKNIFGFLLSNIDNNTDKLKIILKYCQKNIYGFTNCIKITKIYILNMISDNLNLWKYNIDDYKRISKNDIVEKLSILNELYFMILNAKTRKGLDNIDCYLNKIS